MESYTLAQAAHLIAEKLFPPDGYDFTNTQRDECERSYLPLLRDAARSGALILVNPHNKAKFDHARLSDEFFPDDLLITASSLLIWLMAVLGVEEAKRVVPPPVSNAPPSLPRTLTGIPSAPPPPVEYHFKSPNWEHWTRPGTRIRLWEGVCLIVDIEPPRRPGGDELCSLFELKRLPAKFHEAWDVLNRDAQFSKLEEVGTAGRMLHSVNLDGFVDWALYKGFAIPPELRSIASQATSIKDEPAAQQAQHPSPVISAAEWDTLEENEETARDDPRFRVLYDYAADLYDERNQLLERSRQGLPVDPKDKQRLSKIRAELAMLDKVDESPPVRNDSRSEPVKNATPVPELAPVPVPVPVQRTAAQDAALLAMLREKGFDPLALPRNKAGKEGVKKLIREALGNSGLWAGATVFDKAWERLSRNGDIAYKVEKRA